MTAVIEELRMLSRSLIKRMRVDLTCATEEVNFDGEEEAEESLIDSTIMSHSTRWLAHPKTLRLSTRKRPSPNDDGTRTRNFARMAKSGPMPNFIFGLATDVETLSRKLVDEALLPLFRKLHPERSGWDLSLVNICATNMSLAAGDSKNSTGRDIARMFNRQESVLKDWRIMENEPSKARNNERNVNSPLELQARQAKSENESSDVVQGGSEDVWIRSQETVNDLDELDYTNGNICKLCGANMPAFALAAHLRFHSAR